MIPLFLLALCSFGLAWYLASKFYDRLNESFQEIKEKLHHHDKSISRLSDGQYEIREVMNENKKMTEEQMVQMQYSMKLQKNKNYDKDLDVIKQQMKKLEEHIFSVSEVKPSKAKKTSK